MTDTYLSGNTYSISCYASRIDYSDYSVTFETWLYKEDLNTLRDNLRPGAVSELFQVLGKPYYYDQSWTSANTVMLVFFDNESSNVVNMRKSMLLYVKTLSDSPVAGASGWINCKIEGYISGSQI